MGNRLSTSTSTSRSAMVGDGEVPSETLSNIEPEPDINYDILNEKFEVLYNEKLMFKRSPKEVSDITEAVREMACLILEEVGKIDNRLTYSNIHSVGSMAERTRIIEPDEFDFFVVIDNVLFNDAITWARPDHESRGTVHIHVDETQAGRVFRDMSEDGKLRSSRRGEFKLGGRKGIQDYFLDAVRKAVKLIFKRHDTIVKETGELNLSSSNVDQNGVACTFNGSFSWTSMDTAASCPKHLPISVDLTAAFQTTFEKSGITHGDVATDDLYNRLKETNQVFAVPCGEEVCKFGQCFKYSVTMVELEKMQHVNQDHLKCYMILKYLLCGTCKCKWPCLHLPKNSHSTSYGIKNTLLDHVSSCSNRGQSKCILQILMIDDLPSSNDMLLMPHEVGKSSDFIVSDYSIKVLKKVFIIGFSAHFSHPFREVSKGLIKQALYRESVTHVNQTNNFCDSLPIYSSLRQYQFPLVFLLHVLQWLSVISFTCIVSLPILVGVMSSPWEWKTWMLVLILIELPPAMVFGVLGSMRRLPKLVCRYFGMALLECATIATCFSISYFIIRILRPTLIVIPIMVCFLLIHLVSGVSVGTAKLVTFQAFLMQQRQQSLRTWLLLKALMMPLIWPVLVAVVIIDMIVDLVVAHLGR